MKLLADEVFSSSQSQEDQNELATCVLYKIIMNYVSTYLLKDICLMSAVINIPRVTGNINVIKL